MLCVGCVNEGADRAGASCAAAAGISLAEPQSGAAHSLAVVGLLCRRLVGGWSLVCRDAATGTGVRLSLFLAASHPAIFWRGISSALGVFLHTSVVPGVHAVVAVICSLLQIPVQSFIGGVATSSASDGVLPAVVSL